MTEISPHWFVREWMIKMSKKNYVDFSELYKQVGKTQKQLEKNQKDAITYAGEYAARYLKVKTPRDKDGGNREHMRNHVVFSKPTQAKPYSEVGFDKEVAWRVHFVEFGTIKQKPQGFIERTIKDIEKDVANIIQKYMMRGLGK